MLTMRADLLDALVAPSEPSWLVHSLLATGYFALLAGTPGVGKSYFSYSLGLCVASGTPFLGHAVRRGPVLYFDEENGDDAGHYVRELLRGMPEPGGGWTSDFHWYIDELGSKSVDDRYDTMYSLAQTLQPALIIIDTAAQALGIRDENDNSEASRHIEGLRLLRRRGGPNCTVLLLKHARVDPISGKRDIRGAKVWVGAANSVWGLYRPGSGRPKRYGPTVLEAMKARKGSFTGALDLKPVVTNWGAPDQRVTLSATIRPESADG